MNWKWIILRIVGMLIFSAFLLSNGRVTEKPTNELNTLVFGNSATVPSWQISEYWTYSIESDYFQSEVINLVCYDISDGNYYIGADSRDHALTHAVYNINPMLGRQTITNLDVYENGEPKPMYNFPMTDGMSWQNSLFERELTVQTMYNENIRGFDIKASDENGFSLNYNYLPSVHWFSEFSIVDETGKTLYSLELVDHGYGFEGQVYFMRANDLWDSASSDTNQFSVNGHHKYGDFDFLAVGIEIPNNPTGIMFVEISGPSNIGDYENSYRGPVVLGHFLEIPNENGEWTVGYYSNVFSFIKPQMNIRIAGVLEYSAIL